MAINYDRVKQKILEKHPNMDVDARVNALRNKLSTLSREGAALIVANKNGVKIKATKPKATIKTIDSLRAGDDYVEIAGTVISAYDIKFYEVCPDCGKRTREQTGIYKCEKHGVISSPAYSYVTNLMLDDGTSRIRVTLFSKQLEKLLGMNSSQILKFRNNPEKYEGIKMDLLGKLMSFRGLVKESQISNYNDFIAKLVFKEAKDVEPRIEAVKNLVEQAEKIPETDEDDEVTEELVI